jgi:2-polyprenyl-3-methyl-5-hydroxy-6-metoxy-1,4-benzoquinol methylase
MEPNAFVAEVYRRMTLRQKSSGAVTLQVPPTAVRVAQVVEEYRNVLPQSKEANILDIGYGDGWFMAACRSLGYDHISGAEFDIDKKAYLKDWGVKLYRIEKDIGEFLRDHPTEFDFIHMSHVIEHIPKHSLLWVVDAIYQALKVGGMVYLRSQYGRSHSTVQLLRYPRTRIRFCRLKPHVSSGRLRVRRCPTAQAIASARG